MLSIGILLSKLGGNELPSVCRVKSWISPAVGTF